MKTFLTSVLGLAIRITMAQRAARFAYAAWRKG